MLIIFDLDDTLIDTSGCITPIKLQDALRLMIAEGLYIEDTAEALEMLRRLDETAESARHTLAEFLEVHEADPRFLEIGVREVYGNISPEIPIFPFEGVLEVLADLSLHHKLALVSMGRREQQLAKMKKAGVDSQLFSKIVICGAEGKKPHYQSIMEEFDFSPQEVFVCGDRIAVDLAPAKELALKTVHMRKGRGRNGSGSKSDVDYSIVDIEELRNILPFSAVQK